MSETLCSFGLVVTVSSTHQTSTAAQPLLEFIVTFQFSFSVCATRFLLVIFSYLVSDNHLLLCTRSGNGSGGGTFLSYLQGQQSAGPRLVPVNEQTQAWLGSQPRPRQAVDAVMSSPSSLCNAVDGDNSLLMSPSEALLQPVRDMGHSEILRGHFRGTQPFEKGLGFPHRVPELRAWDDVRLKGQVRCVCVRKQTLFVPQQ